MATWKTEIDGEPCWCYFGYSGELIFKCDLLDSKNFDSEKSLETAIKAYKLSLRKDFDNPTAYSYGKGWGKAELSEVTVTSIVDDKEAWIKSKSGRAKTQRSQLFADKSALQAVIELEAESDKKVEAAWASLKRWQPSKAAA